MVKYYVLESGLAKLGIFLAIFGAVGPLLVNYLQVGVFIPVQRKLTVDEVGAPRMSQMSRPRRSIPIPPSAVASAGTLEHQLFLTTSRLSREVGELGRRGSINLVIGVFTTIVGVGILGYVVYTAAGDGEDFGWKSAVHTLLRVSIALFIQTFAYFFLRLYKTSLEDIKYYQNEITNIDNRWLALKAAVDLQNDALMKQVIDSLIKTERNFILKKGDSTLGLERERLEKNEVIELVKEALGTVAKIKPGK